ncbi:MAG TPA: polyphenol oxidase family protein [Gemmatimonadaceae bacterium]|nr:polyphenol oxidase family protein [Gemmatimonadaceae bacterium]
MSVATEGAAARVEAPGFAPLGVVAFTTTRGAGSFGLHGSEPVAAVTARWDALRAGLGPSVPRLATARQVHGVRVLTHNDSWRGWLRADEADGHIAPARGTAIAVSVADCVPIFIAHPSGVVAILHAGWRGTAGGMMAAGVQGMLRLGLSPRDLRVYLGPGVCGDCYEVGPDVYEQITSRSAAEPTRVDLRAVLADQAASLGVGEVEWSPHCTRCDNTLFFSHRAGDEGRQLAVIFAPI